MCALQTLKPVKSNLSESKLHSGKQQKVGFTGFTDNRPEAKQLKQVQHNLSFSPQADRIAQMQMMASSPVVQLKTKITHKTKPFTYPHKGNQITEPVGEEMNAYLDPTDVVVGSATGDPQLDLYHSVQGAVHPMIRGHLLNHDLGGFGVEENLYPITSGANTKHKNHVENHVGDELNKASAAGNGSGVYYSVKVNPIQDTSHNLMNNTSTFVCEAYHVANMNPGSVGTKGALILKANIESMPGGVNHSNAVDPTGANLLPNVAKAVAPGWDHGARKGRQDWNTYVTAGRIQVNPSEEWSATAKILLGLGVGAMTLFAIGGYFYFNPDKLPEFIKNLAASGMDAVTSLREEM